MDSTRKNQELARYHEETPQNNNTNNNNVTTLKSSFLTSIANQEATNSTGNL